jgi:hypothetical protein
MSTDSESGDRRLSGPIPQGFYNNMAMQLTTLNGNLVAANKSAGRLALALNVLTGVIAFTALVELVHRW